jgi:hypothetical protein
MIRFPWAGLALAWAGWAAAFGVAGATEVEHRDFAISVDGKRAGQYLMKITAPENGPVTVEAQADVRVSYLVRKYTYTYRGTETWQWGRLQRLESTANDDGKALGVSAALDGAVLRVRAGGAERLSAPEVWTTTYWRLPDAKFRNGTVALLDADTGRAIPARLQYVDTRQMSVGGQPQNCPHYRVTGEKLQVDLWYDNLERLVRQESLEEGHRTVIELINLRR